MTEPAGGYDAGTAFIQAVLSLKGVEKDAAKAGQEAGKAFVASFDEEVGRKSTPLPVPGKPESRKQGTESAGAFADAFTARVKAALKALPKAKVGVDATAADAELQQIRERLAALGDVRVGVDLSAAEATAELDRLKARLDQLGASSADVQVQADTARAAEQLAVIQAAVDKLDGSKAEVKVDADTSSAESRISRLVSSAGGQRISLGFDAPDPSALLPFGNAIFSVGGAAAAASPLLFALGSSALEASAALAAGIPAAGAFAFSIGTIVAAVSGPLGALKKYEAAQKSAATATQSAATSQGRSAAQIASTELTNARAITSAQDSIASARERQGQVAADVADRIRSAQERVADAERSVASAQDDRKSAQQALTDATRQYALDLADLRDKLSGLALDEEGASISLRRALEDQVKVNKNAKSSALDREEAAYRVAEAQQRLSEVEADRKKTAADLAKSEKDGAKGSAGVIAAQKNIADATARVQAAQRGQADAERDLTKTVTDGKQQQVDAQKAYAKAVQNLGDLQKQQVLQAKIQAEQEAKTTKATGGASAATKAYADSLKKLTPQGRAFLKTLIGFGPAIDTLQATAEKATLPGLTRFLGDVKGLGPLAARGIGLFGRAISDSAVDLGRYVSSPIFKRDFGSILESTSKSTRNLGAAVTPLASIITTLAQASAPLLERFSAFILRGLRLADVFLLNKQRTGELSGFFKRAGDEMYKWGRIVGNFAGALFDLFKGANPAGKTLSDRLLTISQNFHDWTSSTAGQDKIRGFFKFFTDLDYKKLLGIAKTAAELYGTYKAFGVAKSIAKNPFFFLISLAAVKNPEAVSGFVSDVWGAAKPMLDFLSAHPAVFEGFIGLLAALRLTAAASGMGGLLKGIPGLSGVTGGGSSGGIAGIRDVKSRKPGSSFNPIATAGGSDAPGAGGKSGGLGSKIAKGAGYIGGAAAIAEIASSVVDRLNGKQAAPLSKQGLKDETANSPAAVGWKGILGNFLTGRPPSIPTAGLLGAFSGVRSFFSTTLPGWGKASLAASIGTFLHPLAVAPAGLGAAFAPVKSFFTTTAPAWATGGFRAIRGTFEHPVAVAPAGLGAAFSQVRSFFTSTAPSWAKAGLGAGILAFERPRAVAPAGLGAAFAGVRAFFLTTAPGWAKAGATLIGTAFGALQTSLVAPINWIISNVLNRLIGAANFVITKFGGSAIPTFPLIGQGAGVSKTSKPAAGGNSGSGGKNIRLASGGVMPGYTPGRDPHQFYSPTGGRLALSGGEAVMRPEWTRAVGPGFVDRMNALARQGGTSAVRRAMGGPGAFAVGGIIGKIKTVADWGKSGIRTLQQAAAGGLHSAVEFLLAPVRQALEAPQAGPLFASLTGGAINKVVASIFGYADAQPQVGDPSGGGGSAVNIPANVTARIAGIQNFLRSVDPLPYIWGGVGPGGFDCSGLAGEVYNRLTGRASFHRAFTTSSNFAAAGFKPGTGSDFVIGVNPGTHMDGRLAGLPFEAQSTATGIFVGSGATPTSRFRQQWYLPGISATGGGTSGRAIAAAKGGILHAGMYDQGGMLQPGLNLALNATGKPEPVFTSSQAKALMLNANSNKAGAQITNNVANYGQPITAADVTRAQRQAEALLPIG